MEKLRDSGNEILAKQSKFNGIQYGGFSLQKYINIQGITEPHT